MKNIHNKKIFIYHHFLTAPSKIVATVPLTFSQEELDEEEVTDFLNPEELFCECKQVQFFPP